MKQLSLLTTLLLLITLAECGGQTPDLSVRQSELAKRVAWVLPPNWTIDEQDRQIIITRNEPVRSHDCHCLDLSWMRHPELLQEFVDETGETRPYKIRLRLGPRVDLLEHERLTESNARIRITRETVIAVREFYEAASMQSFDPNYRQLPNYYDKESSIYVESTLRPWECIYPAEAALECQGVLDRLDLIFSRYPGTERMSARSWM